MNRPIILGEAVFDVAESCAALMSNVSRVIRPDPM